MLDYLRKNKLGFLVLVPLLFGASYVLAAYNYGTVTYVRELHDGTPSSGGRIMENNEAEVSQITAPAWPLPLDTVSYDARVLALTNYQTPKPKVPDTGTSSASSSSVAAAPILPVYSSSSNVTVPGKLWPAAAVYPNGGAIVPFKRILSYYGNFFSRQMGILGEYEPDEVLRRLAATQALWEAADPNTPVQPAIEYIAMVAQADGGKDGMYRAMMPAKEIEKAYDLAKKANAILILDLQIGLSTIERELPKFKDYIMRPEVHMALDPEFSMKTGDKPGTVIGSHNAADINYVINYMSEIVRANKLPPKVLLVHRFTGNMVAKRMSSSCPGESCLTQWSISASDSLKLAGSQSSNLRENSSSAASPRCSMSARILRTVCWTLAASSADCSAVRPCFK